MNKDRFDNYWSHFASDMDYYKAQLFIRAMDYAGFDSYVEAEGLEEQLAGLDHYGVQVEAVHVRKSRTTTAHLSTEETMAFLDRNFGTGDADELIAYAIVDTINDQWPTFYFVPENDMSGAGKTIPQKDFLAAVSKEGLSFVHQDSRRFKETLDWLAGLAGEEPLAKGTTAPETFHPDEVRHTIVPFARNEVKLDVYHVNLTRHVPPPESDNVILTRPEGVNYEQWVLEQLKVNGLWKPRYDYDLLLRFTREGLSRFFHGRGIPEDEFFDFSMPVYSDVFQYRPGEIHDESCLDGFCLRCGNTEMCYGEFICWHCASEAMLGYGREEVPPAEADFEHLQKLAVKLGLME